MRDGTTSSQKQWTKIQASSAIVSTISVMCFSLCVFPYVLNIPIQAWNCKYRDNGIERVSGRPKRYAICGHLNAICIPCLLHTLPKTLQSFEHKFLAYLAGRSETIWIPCCVGWASMGGGGDIKNTRPDMQRNYFQKYISVPCLRVVHSWTAPGERSLSPEQ